MSQQFEVAVSQKDQTLPMIVNLRGDELIVDEFCVDAEQAMEYLGIKRSRLTQISGRELRVGRIRKDRYLRPVYRMSDLQDYQEWTRATATHQSSSKAIELALVGLDDRFNDWSQILSEALHQGHKSRQESLHQAVKKLQETLLKEHSILRSDLAQKLSLQTSGWERAWKKQGAKLASLEIELAHVTAQLKESELRFTSFHQQLRELLNAVILLRKDVQDFTVHLQKGFHSQEALGQRTLSSLAEFADRTQDQWHHTLSNLAAYRDDIAREKVTGARNGVSAEVKPQRGLSPQRACRTKRRLPYLHR